MHPSFTAALFTIAKMWRQRKCPSTDDWIKKTWNIHTAGYYSAIRKNEIMPLVATWTDHRLSYWVKSERQVSHGITYTWNLKPDTNKHDYETKTDSQLQRRDLWLPRGTGEEEGELGIHRGKLSYGAWISNQVPLYSISVTNHNGKGDICVTESLCRRN